MPFSKASHFDLTADKIVGLGKCCKVLNMFLCFVLNPLPHMLYLKHYIISINNSNFQIFSKKYFLHFNSFENIMENVS